MNQNKLDIIDQITKHLNNYDVKNRNIALLSTNPTHESMLAMLAASYDFSLTPLDADQLLHTYKRRLNENHCEYIFYTKEFSEIVWEIFNDGSTLLNESFLIEDF